MLKKDIYQTLSQYYDTYQIYQILQKETGFTKNQLFLCVEIKSITKD
jgi:hypothetical protein